MIISYFMKFQQARSISALVDNLFCLIPQEEGKLC